MQPMAIMNQPGGFNNQISPGFNLPGPLQNQQQASARPASSNESGQEAYGHLRRNAQRVPHPDDNPFWGNNNQGRRNFRSQGSHYHGLQQNQQLPRHLSVGNEIQGQFVPPNSGRFGGNYQQQQKQPVTSPDVQANNIQQKPAFPSSIKYTDARITAEDSLVQAAMGLEVSSKGTPNGSETVTPQRPINGNACIHSTPATAPPKLGRETPVLRSRKGQSVATLRIDPVRGPPPAFFPSNMQTASTASTAPIFGLALAQLPYQIPARSRKSTLSTIRGGTPTPNASVAPTPALALTRGPYKTPARSRKSTLSTIRGEDPHTAQSITFSPETQRHTTPGNPFGPAEPSSEVAPINLPPLPAHGVSWHLAQIAPYGNKPSPEVALELKNMPFVESLRAARPADFGVVHIANVSASPQDLGISELTS
jgi:hypothetical protein